MDGNNNLPYQMNPIQQKPTAYLKSIKPFSLFAATLLTAIVAGAGGYLLGIRANQNASQDTQRVSFQISPIITAHSLSSTESMATPTFAFPTLNMKVYRNERLGFEFKYLEGYEVIETTNGMSLLASDYKHPILTISTNQITDYEFYKSCRENDERTNRITFPCLGRGESWGQKGDIEETKLGELNAKSFYVDEGVDRDYHIVQTNGFPRFEAKMYVSGGGLDSSFKLMLSTFKLLDNM